MEERKRRSPSTVPGEDGAAHGKRRRSSGSGAGAEEYEELVPESPPQ